MTRKRTRNASIGEEIISGLEGLRDSLRAGDRLSRRFTMRTVQLRVEPQAFTPHQIRSLRAALRASQAVFAMLIGVKPATLQSWEQGRTTPPPWGRRLLELMKEHPQPFVDMLEKGAKAA